LARKTFMAVCNRTRLDLKYMPGQVLGPTEFRISQEFDTPGSHTAGIQEAIDDLPITGGTVIIPNRTQEVDYYINVNKDNVTLLGGGDGSVIKLANGRHSTLTNQATLGQADLIVADGSQFRAGDWICIRDMAPGASSNEWRLVASVDGNTITVTVNLTYNHPANTQVWTCHPILMTDTGVTGFQMLNLCVEGNRANQMEGVLGDIFDAAAGNRNSNPAYISVETWGVLILKDTSDVVIENVKINEMPAHGIFIYGLSQNTTEIIIRNCRITDVADKGIVALQVVGTTPVHIQIENNYIYECGVGVRHVPAPAVNYGDSINFHTPTGTHITIRGNILHQYRRSGIAIDGTKYSIVSDNIITAESDGLSGTAGILFENSMNCVLHNNTVRHYLTPKGGPLAIWSCTDMTVIGGSYVTLDGGANGTYVVGIIDSSGTRPSDITFIGVLIEGNNGTITDLKTLYPLRIIDADRIKVSDCIIKSPGTGRPGLCLENSDKCDIHGNTFYDERAPPKMTYGIALDANSDNNQIQGNRIEGYLTAPIDDNGTNNIYGHNITS